nr:hypothetical protein [Tanacetum cinerariifolium]
MQKKQGQNGTLLYRWKSEVESEGWEDEDKDLNMVYSRKALLGAKEFFVNKKQEEDFDKIKRDIKHESVKELVDGSNGLVEDKLLASNCGKRVCDLGGSRGRNVSGKHAIETNCKLGILVVVTSYVRVEKSLLGSKEHEFGGVREMVPGNFNKHGMGGNEPILNDIFVNTADKLTDKWFKISTFMETQKVFEYSKRIREPVRYKVCKGIKENEFVPEEVPGQCTLISLNLVTRHKTCVPTKKRIRDLDVLSTRVKQLVKNAKETRLKWSSSLSMEIRGGEVTKFGLIKEKAIEILESEFVMELMLITNMYDKPFESMSRSCECCYSQWSYVVVIEFVIIVSVEGVSQLNHLDSCQSMVEEEVPKADIEVPEQVDTKKANIEEKLGSQSHMTSFSNLGFSDSSFSDLTFGDLSFSDLSESHTEVGTQLTGNKTISGNSLGLGHLKSVRGKLSCCILMILEDKNLLKGKALIWINWNSQYKLNRKVKAAQIAITAFLAKNLAASDPLISSFKYSSMYANKDILVGRSTLVGSLDLNSFVDSLLAGFKRPASKALYHQSLLGTRNTIGQGEACCKYCATCRYNHPERYVMVPPAAIAATHALRMNIGLVNPTPFLQTLDSSVGQTTLGLGISIYPQRPGQLECLPRREGAVKCPYYMKTGACNCKFNHPKDKAATSFALKNEGSALPERPFEPPCSFYMKNGVCKYGSACKFHHPKDISVATGGAGNANGQQNTIKLTLAGLPRREGAVKCPYYMKTEACKYGATCKFDHPPPGKVMAVVTSQGASTTTGEEVKEDHP